MPGHIACTWIVNISCNIRLGPLFVFSLYLANNQRVVVNKNPESIAKRELVKSMDKKVVQRLRALNARALVIILSVDFVDVVCFCAFKADYFQASTLNRITLYGGTLSFLYSSWISSHKILSTRGDHWASKSGRRENTIPGERGVVLHNHCDFFRRMFKFSNFWLIDKMNNARSNFSDLHNVYLIFVL